MKVIISQSSLSLLISKLQSIVPSRPTMPILSNILLEAQDDQITLSATDLMISMKVHAEAKVLEEGSITLPAKRFFQLIRELTSPQLEMHLIAPEVVQINSGSSHFKIHGMSKDEFPHHDEIITDSPIHIQTAILKDVLGKTAFAAARDDSRQVLNGILLQMDNHTATFIGTDGKKLAKSFGTISSNHSANGSFILPIKAVEEMIRMLDTKDESVSVYLNPSMIALETSTAILISKLIAGQYPDIARIIPQKSTSPVFLHREELISLLRQMSLFTSEHNPSVRFTFTNGELHLSANSGDIGEGKVHMPVNYSGEKLDIAFNPNYFIDILRHTKDETVHFELTDSYNPGLITDSSEALFVLMPMRLDV